MREMPGNACWFGMYEASKAVFVARHGGVKADVPWYAAPISGGIGGLCYWSVCFPADVVKTRMQSSARFAALGLRRGLVEVYREGGVRALYAGYGITCLRAFPANAAVFSVYEVTSSVWKAHMVKGRSAPSPRGNVDCDDGRHHSVVRPSDLLRHAAL
jgi:hypothetical protein